MLMHISLEELDAFAAQFWAAAGASRVFAFHGPMGAGKTTTIAALCRHKGVRDAVSSPTFAIIHEYSFTENGVPQPIFHIDLYRLQEADEVVQLYVRDPVASVARPVRELRGFKRVDLGVGARKRITFTLTPEQLAFWGPRGQWLVEAGRIDFWIGASSADLRASGSFEITKAHTGSGPAAALPTRVIVSNTN